MAFVGFLFLCLVWGTSWVAIKYSLEGFPPFIGASLRFAAAAAALIVYSRWRSIPLALRGQPWRILWFTGFLVYTLNYGLIYWAEQYLKAGVTAVTFATFPVFVGLFSNFIFKSEPFRYNVYAGLLLGFLGVFLTFQEDLGGAGKGSLVLLATLAVLLSSVAAALSSVIVKKRLSFVHPVQLTFHQMCPGLGSLLLLSFLASEFSRVTITPRSFAAVLYLGWAASALAFVLYYWLLQKWSAVSVSLLIYFNPLVAVLCGWILLGETLSRGAIAGSGFVLAGVLLSQAHHYRGLLLKSQQARSQIPGEHINR